jgi:hypothetical protein
MPSHVLISSVKNEGPFLLEWVAHHLGLGFDAIYVASNDCSDGTAELLDALHRAGVVVHMPNIIGPDDIPQHAGYLKIRQTHPIDAADWLMVLDADEFLNVHIGAHTVQDLTALAGPQTDIIRVFGRTFSDTPQTCWTPGQVTQLFPNALPAKSRTNTSLKTLTTNPRRFGKIHNHHMARFKGAGPLNVFCAGSGTHFQMAVDAPLSVGLRHAKKPEIGHRIAQYNHYSIKTLDSFTLRRLRGRGARPPSEGVNAHHTYDYFDDRSAKGAPELSIARYNTKTTAMLQRLLQEPEILAAHLACEAAHGAAIRALADQMDMD